MCTCVNNIEQRWFYSKNISRDEILLNVSINILVLLRILFYVFIAYHEQHRSRIICKRVTPNPHHDYDEDFINLTNEYILRSEDLQENWKYLLEK